MSDDALYLIDLFEQMQNNLQDELMNKTISNKTFDRFSYSSWAIQEIIIEINEYEYYTSVAIIREILKNKETDYERFYNVNKSRNIRYLHALDTIKYMLELTGGYINA